ncbi:MAG: hypothetical protein MZV64_56585 [Ignavibacteriales bacterium]|nr:hypothetical protein [Ignavibacteriales bacterium]
MREEKMRKQLLVLFTLVVISIISFTGCEPFIENKITVQNHAAGDVQLDYCWKNCMMFFHNSSLVLADFKKELLNMKQFISVPFGVTDASAEGDVARKFGSKCRNRNSS